MRKNSLLIICCLLLSSTAFAKVITYQEALSRLRTSKILRVKGMAASTPTLLYTGRVGDVPAFYVFDQGNDANKGFIILSADDQMSPIIGYSDRGTSFDIDNLPEGMSAYLDDVRDYVSQLRRQAEQVQPSFAAVQERAEIKPLLTTQWAQNAPYNNMAPRINGTTTVAGCVPVAMAQMMKHHRHP